MRETCSVTYMGATHDESVVDLLCKSTMHTDGLREIGTGHRSLEEEERENGTSGRLFEHQHILLISARRVPY